jgi:hypothetical protein
MQEGGAVEELGEGRESRGRRRSVLWEETRGEGRWFGGETPEGSTGCGSESTTLRWEHERAREERLRSWPSEERAAKTAARLAVEERKDREVGSKLLYRLGQVKVYGCTLQMTSTKPTEEVRGRSREMTT